MFLAVCIPRAEGHGEQLNSPCPELFGPWEGQHTGQCSRASPPGAPHAVAHGGRWAGTNVCLFCRHKDGVGLWSQPLWPAEGRVVPALLSSLRLCSLKSSTELGGSGYSSIAGVVATRNSFPAEHLKSITVVQSFVLRHQPSFVLLFQLAVV